MGGHFRWEKTITLVENEFFSPVLKRMSRRLWKNVKYDNQQKVLIKRVYTSLD